MEYNTLEFWQTLLTKYEKQHQRYFCFASNDFNILWWNNDFKTKITYLGQDFLDDTGNKFLYTPKPPFSTNQEVALFHLKDGRIIPWEYDSLKYFRQLRIDFLHWLILNQKYQTL